MNPLPPLVHTEEKHQVTETMCRKNKTTRITWKLHLVIFFSNFGMISQVDFMCRLSLSRNSIHLIRIYFNLMCLNGLPPVGAKIQ